jgi:hypothetical protein
MIMRIPALHMLVRKAADWDESKHPRADNGRFGSGSGGSKKPSKTRRKMERREEAASQARVGGAIQSLLSGGSALDKIGWLNTSEPKEPEPEKPAAKPKEEAAPAKEPTGGLSDFTEAWINQSKYADKYRANPHLINHQQIESKWRESLIDAARLGPLSEAAINSFKEKYGETELLRTFRGREGKGLANYVPDDKGMAHQQNPMMFGPPAPEAPKAKEPTPQTDIKVEDGELAGSKILSLGNKRAGVLQHADGSFVVLSQVDRKTVDRKEFKHLDVANRYAEAWLKGGQEVPKQPEKPKVEEKPTISRPDADAWAKSSKYRADVYHVTNSKNVKNIKDNGFKQAGGQSLGASWGNGTYLALDAETADYYQRLTPNAEKLTLKVNVKNPITFDASNISDIEDGAKAIAEQIGQSEDYDRIRSELDIKNKKVEQEATAKFGRLSRAGQKLPGESDDEFITRFEDIRQKRIAFMRENGAHEFPHSDALTQVAQAAGYDAIIIRDKEFRPEVGGNQIVVFNPKDVKVVGQSENNESQDPEPETWYDSDKYQRVADTLLNNLKSGKIKVSEADKIHAEKTKSFSELTRNKNRSPSDDLKMQKISNELGAMQYALNRFKQGEPDARRRRF